MLQRLFSYLLSPGLVMLAACQGYDFRINDKVVYTPDPLFSDFDTGNEREPWVGELYAGFGVQYDNFEFSYVQTYRTKEYEEQDDGSNFGSVALRWNL